MACGIRTSVSPVECTGVQTGDCFPSMHKALVQSPVPFKLCIVGYACYPSTQWEKPKRMRKSRSAWVMRPCLRGKKLQKSSWTSCSTEFPYGSSPSCSAHNRAQPEPQLRPGSTQKQGREWRTDVFSHPLSQQEVTRLSCDNKVRVAPKHKGPTRVSKFAPTMISLSGK